MTLSNGDQRGPPAPPEGVDAICDVFEAAWLAGQAPRIEDFLPGGEPVHQDVLLRELLLAEWDLHRRHEQHVKLQTYLQRFSESSQFVAELWHDWQAKQSQGSLDDRANGLATALHTPPAEELGTVIGRYKLLEKLGDGGFGTVWAAEQREPVKRRVALKVIKLGMDARQVIARFEAERQALALMDHPNIAKVLDADSTESGRPYFVMELVRGIPITTYCDQERPATQDRLDLFMTVCHAIQHAHQKGIIHRDIKPSNILVTLHDGVPVPKVIDFGIAKAIQQELTEKTIYTQLQQFIGTPAYMSPEQAEMSGLDIDTRSDIYSLGVLLYELLTGMTPFNANELMRSGLDEMRKIIREREPLRPSSRLTKELETAKATGATDATVPGTLRVLHSAIDRDLDWIVMKALEKDRNRRYETANSFAEDVQRYLADEPVQACPPSAAYRMKKFVQRNKGPVVAAGLVLLSLIAGVVGTTYGLIRAEQQRLVVEGQRQDLAERNQALQAAHEHERVLNERARQAIETVASETAIEQLTRQKELRTEQKEFLDKIIQYYAESGQEEAATEEERSRQARAYHRMGRMNQILGRSHESENAFRRAVALRKQLVADFPAQPELQLELASSHNNLGDLLLDAGRAKEADAAFVEALAIQKQLAADFPTRVYRQVLAGIHNNLGNVFLDAGRMKEAEAAHAEALAIRKQLAADFPAEPSIRRALGMSHNNLGWVLHSTGRLKEAESAFRDALVLKKQVVVDFPNRPEFRLDLAQGHYNLCNLLRDTERPKEAEAAHAEALAIYRQLVADFPNRPEFGKELADAEEQGSQLATDKRERLEDGGGVGLEGDEVRTGRELEDAIVPKK